MLLCCNSCYLKNIQNAYKYIISIQIIIFYMFCEIAENNKKETNITYILFH